MKRDYLLKVPRVVEIIRQEAWQRGLEPSDLTARYAPRRPPPKPVWEARRAAVLKALNLGKTLASVAREFGHDRTTLLNWVRSNG